MMKRAMLALCLISALLLSFAAQAENAGGLREYMGIAFDTATPDTVAQIILQQNGEAEPGESDQYRITDFGYEWNMTVDYNPKGNGASRVFLARSGSGYAFDPAFEALFKKDILQFLDVEQQLIKSYGEPDARYFQSDSYKYDQKSMTNFMLASGQWSQEALEDILQCDKNLIASSEWNNVCLRLWVNWTDVRANGYLTKLDLYFLDSPLHAKPLTIIEYPRATN